RPFALATKEVTWEQFHHFRADYSPREVDGPLSPNNPATSVSFYLAAAYCNWLSQQEGLPLSQWCYVQVADPKTPEKVQAYPDYLSRTGYRLPTEVEWEYACRSGAMTSRCYGSSNDLLAKYAWYNTNSRGRSQPVGLLKPNDLGLFDMHGNAW